MSLQSNDHGLSKVHFSQYITTENKPDEETKPTEPTEPEKPAVA